MPTPESSVEKLRRQIVKSLMDVIVLAELQNGKMSGYDLISIIHDKFRILLSAGTVYSHLYALERDGLIEVNSDDKKIIYGMTEKGDQVLKQISPTNNIIDTLRTDLNL